LTLKQKKYIFLHKNIRGGTLFLEEIKEKVSEHKIKWRGHASQRMIERDIKRQSVMEAILKGEIIEDYPEDFPFPSCLILGFSTDGIPIHVVCSIGQDYLWIITVYHPEAHKWEPDLKTRKTR